MRSSLSQSARGCWELLLASLLFPALRLAHAVQETPPQSRCLWRTYPDWMLASAVVPSGEQFAWLAPVLFIPTNVVAYATPVWILRRTYARRAQHSYDKKA